MTERRKVLVACCNGSGWIHKHVAFAAMRMLQDPRHTVKFIAPTHSPYVNNLHITVADFLKEGHDYLLLMDDDNPPKQNPLDLVEIDLDIVGLPTPVWNNQKGNSRPYYTNSMEEVRGKDGKIEGVLPIDLAKDFPNKGLIECDSVGTGCMLIARRVLLTLMELSRGKPMETPFMRKWNDQGTVELGNDFAFCQRARYAGFKVFAHYDYQCMHFNEVELTEVINSLIKMRLNNG